MEEDMWGSQMEVLSITLKRKSVQGKEHKYNVQLSANESHQPLVRAQHVLLLIVPSYGQH